eukprot:15061208-Alexandrium_andersonii.AAC.1
MREPFGCSAEATGAEMARTPHAGLRWHDFECGSAFVSSGLDMKRHIELASCPARPAPGDTGQPLSLIHI